LNKRRRILAISGSLRARSSNTELLRAAALIAAPFADIVSYDGIGTLPHFNPDLDFEGAELPSSVVEFRKAIGEADAILISSPEYAHGVPGSLKNALDWLVSGPEMPGKATGLLNASARSLFAHAALEETLRTMSADVVAGAVVVVPMDGRRLDASSIVADPALAPIIEGAVRSLIGAK
jgi:NAD(P)H-dependent FMN reductase